MREDERMMKQIKDEIFRHQRRHNKAKVMDDSIITFHVFSIIMLTHSKL